MSRRKRGADRSSATQAPARPITAASQSSGKTADSIANGDGSLRGQAKSRRFLLAGMLLPVLVAAAWWLGLVVMAIFTANPITLNREQILHADLVVTGTVDADQPTAIVVEKEWMPAGNLDRIVVENLPETGARAGHSYVIPLTMDANGRYFVTKTKDARLLIYPAEEEAEQQLAEILSQRP